MSGKQTKRVRKEVRRKLRGDFEALFNAICDRGLRYRAKVAWRILWRRKI